MFLAGHGGGEDRPKELEEQGQNLSSMTKEDGWQGVWPGAGLSWVPRCRAWGGRIARGEDSDPGLREHLGDS